MRNRKGLRKKPKKAGAPPAERKARNRTVVVMVLLGLLNAYVFLWRAEGSLDDFGDLPVTAMAGRSGALPAYAEPPEAACTGHAVRIFEGLEGLLRVDTDLTGGRTLRLALLEIGVRSVDIDRVEVAVRERVDLGLLARTGAPVRLALDRHGGVHALEVELAEGHLLQACRNPGGFVVRNIQHPLRTDVVVLGTELGRDSDLTAALTALDEAPELAPLVAKALSHDLDFLNEARPGDRLQVMVEKRWLGRTFHRYGDVLAVRYLGTAARVAYYRYKPEGMDAALFDRDGESRQRTLLRSPVAFVPVTREVRALLEPKIEMVEGLMGAMYRLPQGAPIVSLAQGKVRQVGSAGEAGTVVEVEMADGLVARYAHLLRAVGELEVGDSVLQGQLIGLAGHTGQTPNDRLRLELWRENNGARSPVDPLMLTAKGETRPPRVGVRVQKEALDGFREDLRPWARALRQAG